jgi:hypothetical protein
MRTVFAASEPGANHLDPEECLTSTGCLPPRLSRKEWQESQLRSSSQQCIQECEAALQQVKRIAHAMARSNENLDVLFMLIDSSFLPIVTMYILPQAHELEIHHPATKVGNNAEEEKLCIHAHHHGSGNALIAEDALLEHMTTSSKTR